MWQNLLYINKNIMILPLYFSMRQIDLVEPFTTRTPLVGKWLIAWLTQYISVECIDTLWCLPRHIWDDVSWHIQTKIPLLFFMLTVFIILTYDIYMPACIKHICTCINVMYSWIMSFRYIMDLFENELIQLDMFSSEIYNSLKKNFNVNSSAYCTLWFRTAPNSYRDAKM